MTKNIIVGNINDNIPKICNIMKQYDIGFLPIASKNKIVGVITDRDIVIKIINNNDEKSTISNYMNKEIITIDKNNTIEEVLNIMGEKKIKRILITDKKKIIGIISISDLLGQSKNILNTIEKIFKIGPNKHHYETEIDEFYL